MHERVLPDGSLPEIVPGAELLVTPNYRVVTDYKPGLEGQRAGERFFIEPRTGQGYSVLLKAAIAHNIYNFNHRPIPGIRNTGADLIPSLRADYSRENLPAIFDGVVEIPQPGEDTIPPPQRMEACMANGREYTFADGLSPTHGIPNPHTRHLRLLQATFKDEPPTKVIHSNDPDSYYKVRKNWWVVLMASLEVGLDDGEFSDLETAQLIEQFFGKFRTRTFMSPDNLTTLDDIAVANRLITTIWGKYGVSQL